MSSRGLATLALLLVASGAERLAYYGGRSFLPLAARDGGMTASEIGVAVTALTCGGIPAVLLGAALVLAIGPRWTAAAGALLCTIAAAMLAAGAPLLLGWVCWTLGAGLFRTCPYVAAAEVLGTEQGSPSPRRFAAVAAFTVAVAAAANVAAGASSLTSRVLDHFGRAPAYGLLTVFALLAALLAGGAALVRLDGSPAQPAPTHDPYRMPAPPPAPAGAGSPASATSALGGVALLFVPSALYAASGALASPSTVLYAEHFSSLRTSDIAWLFGLDTSVTTIVSVVLFVVLLAVTLTRSSLPPLVPFGVGLGVAGVGLIVAGFAVVGAARELLGVFAVGTALSALGSAAAPIGIAYAALAIRGRSSAFVVAGWSAVLTVANAIVSPLAMAISASSAGRLVLAILVGLVATAVGVAVAALSPRMHRALFAA